MIEWYELRMKHSLVMYNMMLSLYASRLNNDPTTYTVSFNRIIGLTNLLATCNMQTRKALALQKLDCDSYPVQVTYKGEQLTLIFSHAMIKVLSHADAVAY